MNEIEKLERDLARMRKNFDEFDRKNKQLKKRSSFFAAGIFFAFVGQLVGLAIDSDVIFASFHFIAWTCIAWWLIAIAYLFYLEWRYLRPLK